MSGDEAAARPPPQHLKVTFSPANSKGAQSRLLLTVCPPEELARKLKPLGDEERSTILRLKERECEKRKLPFNGQLHAWDMRYFMTQVSLGE